MTKLVGYSNRMEPRADVVAPREREILASIAISLKRIADRLCAEREAETGE